jgi:DNA primase
MEVFIEDRLRINDESVEGRARAAEQVLEQIRRLPGDLERSLYVKKLAALTNLDVELLQSKVRGGRVVQAPVRRPSAQASPERQPAKETGQTQKYLLRLMLSDDQQRRRVREEGTEELFLDEIFRGLANYLLDCEDEEGRLPEALVDASLEEAQQSLLASLVFQDEQGWADNPEKIFVDCRRAASHYVLKERLRQIGRLEEEAQHNDDEAALVRCQRERIEINQKLKKKL